MLAAYFAQKAQQFAAKGISDDFADPMTQDWLLQLAGAPKTADTEPLRLFGLKLDDRYVAIWGAGRHGPSVSGMITSFDTEGEIARTSPGELLLEWVIGRLCAEGHHLFDFGVGEAHYKTLWSDTTIPLFDSYLHVSKTGAAITMLLRSKQSAKRMIKQSPRLMALMARARRLLRG